MQQHPVLTCPKCDAVVRVAPLGFLPVDTPGGDGHRTILKRCPRCQAWSWMTLQPQETT